MLRVKGIQNHYLMQALSSPADAAFPLLKQFQIDAYPVSLKSSKAEDVTASPGTVFHCPIVLTLRKFFLRQEVL